MAMGGGDYGQLNGLNESVSTPGGPGSVGLHSSGPMSNIPMTPSPAAPLSNAPLMTPSPAPQTSMYSAMIATPSPAVAPSPAGPTSVQPPGSVGNPGSHFQPSPLPPSSVGPASVGRPAGDFVSSTRPIATDTKTLTRICRKRKKSGKSPLEEFLMTVFTLKQYERGLSKEPQTYTDLKISPGLIHFTTKSVSYEISFSGVEDCKIVLRLSLHGNECAIVEEDLPMLERYFSEKVLPLESFSALQTFCRILSQSNRPVGRSFVAIMDDELNPNWNSEWGVELLMVSPSQSSTIIPGRTASGAGGPGVRYNKEQTSVLFYIRLHSKEQKPQPVAVPVIALVYDFNQRSLQLYGIKNEEREATARTKEMADIILRNTHSYANKKQECCIWPAVSDLKRNLTWPPNSSQHSNPVN